MSFFDNYSRLCQGIGRSPSSVGSELGFSTNAVSGWRNRGSAPRASTLRKIADYFGVSVQELLAERPIEVAAPASKVKQPTEFGELSEREREIILAFRNADDKQKLMAEMLLKL